MADGGRDRCFEDVVCILVNDETQATVVVSMVIQLLQPPLPLCVNVGAVSLVDRCGAIQYVHRPMTTAVASMTTVVMPNTSRHPLATFRSRRSCSADGAGHANPSKL